MKIWRSPSTSPYCSLHDLDEAIYLADQPDTGAQANPAWRVQGSSSTRAAAARNLASFSEEFLAANAIWSI
jgi:hypothetical protein